MRLASIHLLARNLNDFSSLRNSTYFRRRRRALAFSMTHTHTQPLYYGAINNRNFRGRVPLSHCTIKVKVTARHKQRKILPSSSDSSLQRFRVNVSVYIYIYRSRPAANVIYECARDLRISCSVKPEEVELYPGIKALNARNHV